MDHGEGRLAAARRITDHSTDADQATDDAMIDLSILMAALPAERRAATSCREL